MTALPGRCRTRFCDLPDFWPRQPHYLRKDAVSEAVFIEEGARCDRFLGYEGAGDIQHAASVNLLTSVGVDRGRMSDVLGTVANHLDCLTRARWKVTDA